MIVPLQTLLDAIHRDIAPDRSGDIATYIPELSRMDPEHFGIAVVMADGTTYASGDVATPFTIQSMSKPFAYAAALDLLGRDAVLARVGVEPTGEAFNAIVLDQANNRPFNPMVNSGAIAVCALYPGVAAADSAARMLDALGRFVGRPVSIDEAVYRSESETGHRNRAMAYLMQSSQMLAAAPDIALETYFRQCSVQVDTVDLATMAATLANGGVNPRTGAQAVSPEYLQDVLTVMLSCGMYDYAGQWAYEVGLPAKSGVSGGVLAVVPGEFGIAAFSPRLDSYGNSVRAVAAIRALARDLSLHVLRGGVVGARAPVLEMTGAQVRSRRWRPPADMQVLDTVGAGVLVLRPTGALLIGGAEGILRRAARAVAEGQQVVLDLGRVTEVSAGAGRLLADTLKTTDATAFRLAAASDGVLARLGITEYTAGGQIWPSLDAALEDAEDSLLAGQGGAALPQAVRLQDAPFLDGMTPLQISGLLAAAPPVLIDLARGDRLIQSGTVADRVYVVASGSVRVEIERGDRPPLRIAAHGPGALVGEMALIDDAPRSADVVAETAAQVWAMDLPALRTHLDAQPNLRARLLNTLSRDLSQRLRRANATLLAFEDR